MNKMNKWKTKSAAKEKFCYNKCKINVGCKRKLRPAGKAERQMLRSMTGYGRAQGVGAHWDVTVEIRSVNHRYFEFTSRIPKAYLFLEDKLKGLAQAAASRGKVEVLLSVYPVGEKDVQIAVDEAVARGYLTALRAAAPALGLEDNLKLEHLLRFNDVFTVQRAEIDEEEAWEEVKSVAEQAMAAYRAMKELEGERLKADLSSRLDTIAEILTQIEQRAPKLQQEYHERLRQKLQEVLSGAAVDENRLLTEAAIYAEKVAVDEETVRLRSHLHQFAGLIESDEPVGRKLDFLVQELNRETNTIGSKVQDVTIARMVVDIKAEIEKIREQIQNIE
jgi:uncharacterized protein (TIGR00255 family)